MPIVDVRQAVAGRQFTLAVRDAIDAAKGGDPLHPVAVVVPSNLAGLSLRRLLGSGGLDAQPRLGPVGVANVSFTTPFQLASRLAAPELARSGARPLTTAVLAAAVRHVLSTDPGRFGEVAAHVATETALVRAYGELTELDPGQLATLAEQGNDRTADLVGFVRAVSDYLESEADPPFHDEYAVFHTAGRILDEGSAALERVVLAGPFSPGPSSLGFLQRLASAATTTALVALSGDADVDADSVARMAQITGADLRAREASPPLPTAMIPAADSDDEVRAIVREVLACAAAGARFERMAVFYPLANPYARTLREQFAAAGIPTAGVDHRRLGESMTGRLVGRLLDLARHPGGGADRRFERQNVLALVGAGPVRGPSGRVRPGAWETVSRRAGVVGGLDDWNTKLAAHADRLRREIVDPRNADRAGSFFSSREREAAIADDMGEFVRWLHDRTAGADIEPTWEARSQWLAALLAELLPPVNARARWPEVELDAADRIEQVLARVAVLDAVEPAPGWGSFARAIELELDAPMGRRGRFGTGVLVAPLASAAGVDLDHVFVLGLAEGLCPRSIREDTLVPDDQRAVLGSVLPSRADRLLEERRRYLFALAAAGVERTVSSPLGDHRSGRTRTVSRWWVQAINALEGGGHRSSHDWADSTVGPLRAPASFVQALDRAADRDVAASAAEVDLQVARLGDGAGLDADLQRRLDALAERASGFNRFTGDLSGIEIPTVGADGGVSATRLEMWASCPRRYFFSQLLRLGHIDEPDRIEEISALDRGSMLHESLEEFIRDALPGGARGPIDPATAWARADRARLEAVAASVYDRFEGLGRTGRPLLWGIQRELIGTELATFLRRDSELRRDKQSRPDQVEMAIGFAAEPGAEPAPPARIELPDGRILELRGYADRVDLREDGSPLVLDYKTGKAYTKSHFESDPVVGGTRLQLGVYAEAAQQRYGTARAGAWYWFTSERGRFTMIGYEWDDEKRRRFTEAVLAIVTGIESGVFPPNPGDFNEWYGTFENCRYCDFDRVCSRDRGQEYARAATTGRIDGFTSLSLAPEAGP